jgi:hypothetical protein
MGEGTDGGTATVRMQSMDGVAETYSGLHINVWRIGPASALLASIQPSPRPLPGGEGE